MSVEKYYPNFTDEKLEIGRLSDLAEVTPYLLSGGAMPWARSQKSILSPWQHGRTPFVLKEENRVCLERAGGRQDKWSYLLSLTLIPLLSGLRESTLMACFVFHFSANLAS